VDKRRARAPEALKRLRQQRQEALLGKGRERFVAEETARAVRRQLGRTYQGKQASPYRGRDRRHTGSSRVTDNKASLGA
jgi:uncharacterized protein (DUF2252 family)